MIDIILRKFFFCILRAIMQRSACQASSMPESPGAPRQLIEVDALCSDMQSSSGEKDIKPACPGYRNKKQEIDEKPEIEQEVRSQMQLYGWQISFHSSSLHRNFSDYIIHC